MNSAPHAQNIVQLYEQLDKAGYTEAEIARVGEAYAFVARLFSGRFRPTGRPFVDHLVATASILIRHQLSLPVILAGLAHAVYREGDFGTLRPAITTGKRKMVSRILGERAENLACAYAVFKWNHRKIRPFAQRLSRLSRQERDLMIVRMANELEEAIGLDFLHYTDARRIEKTELLLFCADIAEGLKLPLLAAEMRDAHDTVRSKSLPSPRLDRPTCSYTLPPLSYKKRLIPSVLAILESAWRSLPASVRSQF
jgi:(p)ppGpp synthase/HD superfamily hydrolase